MRFSCSEPVHAGNFAHNITTFVVGYAIAFARSWQLSLVMLSVVPALAIAGLVFGSLAGKLSTQAADAYGVANSIVQQVLCCRIIRVSAAKPSRLCLATLRFSLPQLCWELGRRF